MSRADHAEISEARAAMMARRRRSLSILVGGSVLFTPLAFVFGGMLWLLAVPFLVGLAGYLYFLRTQALNDRERRAVRHRRELERAEHGYDAADDLDAYEDRHNAAVRIDDDDLELHGMDTIDLTGLYEDGEQEPSVVVERRAS